MRWLLRLRRDGKRKDEVNVKCAADTREAEEEAAEEVEEAGGSSGDAEEVAAAADSETASAAVILRASNTEGGRGRRRSAAADGCRRRLSQGLPAYLPARPACCQPKQPCCGGRLHRRPRPGRPRRGEGQERV